MSGVSNSESHEELGPSDILDLEDRSDVEGLIAILEHSNKQNVVKLVINALGRLKDDRAVQPLIEWGLQNPLVSIRAAAVRALGEIGNDNAVEPVMDVLLKNKNIKTEAIETLGKLRAGNAVNVLAFVVNDEGEDQQTREKALESLGNIANEEAVMSLIAALSGTLGDKASAVLKEIGERAVGPLISALGSDNETIICKAAVVLGDIGDKRAVESLIALLLDKSKDEYDRGYCVATALSKIGDSRAVEPLINLASKHDEDMLTCMSVRALGDIGDRRAVDSIIAILEDERTLDGLHSHLRLEACGALGKLRDARAVESLSRIADGRSREESGMREAAAWALIELGDNRIELPLLKYYQECSKDEVLVKLITRLLRKNKNV